MRSSGSTPNRPEPAIRLGIVLVGDDHARACTGRRLLRQGLARKVGRPGSEAGRAVILDPYAPVPLSAADRSRARSAGVVAVDCSWNRLSSAHAKDPRPAGLRDGGRERRLPMLLAANPQHFGRVGELNTAEALAAALCVLGQGAEARRLLEGFAGGRAFFELNRERLERYARAASADELLREERALFGGG
jgi:pre-rRNA-processing protein TSR3